MTLHGGCSLPPSGETPSPCLHTSSSACPEHHHCVCCRPLDQPPDVLYFSPCSRGEALVSHSRAEVKAEAEALSAVLREYKSRCFLQQQSHLKKFLLQVTATLCHSLSQSEEPLLPGPWVNTVKSLLQRP